ncbi:MAG TPA: PIN domain-containing protein [Verrucomicrobiae bacterium]|jgi:predicted nucleic acid-binding protein
MTQNNGPVFVDTNIWLYAFIRGQSVDKTPIAQAVISNQRIIVSTQVISEICVNLIRKASFSEAEIRELVAAFFQKHTVVLLNEETFLTASLLRERHGLSYWDSLLISAALNSGAARFYSEDMQDGQVIEGKLQIVNPFAKKGAG